MALGKHEERTTGGARGIAEHPLLKTLVALVALVSGTVGVYFAWSNTQASREGETRLAADTVRAKVLEIGQEHRERGDGFSGRVLVLAEQAERTILDFGEDALGLGSLVYRQLTEYVAYSTSDLALARRMADRVLDHPAPAAIDVVRTHWALGSIAAQRGERDEMHAEFEAASALARRMPADEAHLQERAVEQTEAFRLLAALLGADRTRDADRAGAFCRDADSWRGDLVDVRRHYHSSLVEIQVQRIVGRDRTHRDLPAACGWPNP